MSEPSIELNRAARRKIARLLGVDLSQVTRAVILAIGGIKGGIGKSTTAIFLAFVYAALGLKVLIIDADPKSGTSRKWNRHARKRATARGEDPDTALPFDVKVHPSEDLEDTIIEAGWHKLYDLIILDTGGDNDRIIQAAYAIADFMLLTASPSPVDLDTLADSARTAIGEAGERDIPHAILLTAVKSRRMADDAKKEMRGKGIPVLNRVVTHRTPYQLAYGTWPEKLWDYHAIQEELDRGSPTPEEKETTA